MTRIPFCCADCSFVPDNFVRDPRPCPRCGGLVFRLGEVLLTVSAGRVKPSGPMTRQTVAGLTANDQRFLRSMRIGW